MVLTLNAIAKEPSAYRYSINTSAGTFVLRPLESNDEEALVKLIEGLSDTTKQFYSYTEPAENIAKEHCEAINKYDKLRFVLENETTKELIGLFEFSMDIPGDDLERFKKYDLRLSNSDCRIGPLIKDEYQSQGIATAVVPVLIAIAKQFGKKQIILWGGVQKDNAQALRFYERNKFKTVGEFINSDNKACYDMIRTLE